MKKHKIKRFFFQIMPVSIKWRETIESRLEEERRITLQAVAKGAMLNPGRFWNLSGTFLFTIYVMTALGKQFKEFRFC